MRVNSHHTGDKSCKKWHTTEALKHPAQLQKWKPQLSFKTTSVIKRFLCLQQSLFQLLSPSYTRTGDRQTSSLWQASSQATILTTEKWIELSCVAADLGREIKNTHSHRSHECCFIHWLFCGSTHVGWTFRLSPMYSGLANGITSSHKAFRCESPPNSSSNAWVGTLSSLKYTYHVGFDPRWNTTPSPAWMWKVLQATVSCFMYFIIA